MSKVKIKNVCEAECIGFSFKPMLKPNQTTVVEEEVVTDADKRLIDKGLAVMEEWDGVIDKAPIVPEQKVEKTEEKPSSREIITDKTLHPGENDSKPEDEIVTPDDVAEEKTEDAPVPETTAEAEEEAATPKIYTREELEALDRGQLREVGAPLGVRGRSVEKLVDDILEAQGTKSAE